MQGRAHTTVEQVPRDSKDLPGERSPLGVDSPMVARIIVDVTFKNHTTVGRVNVSEE